MKRYVITLIFLAIARIAASQSIEQFADSLMSKYHIPELGYAIVKPDSILEIKILGYHRADLKNNQPKAQLSDYFHLGSNTKAITAFAAAYMVEKGKIKWDTKFFDLFPKFKKQSNKAYYDITLADLLSHKARIEPYTSGIEFQELPEFTGSISEKRKQFALYVLREKPVKASPKKFDYSNAGYSIAALMLEKVSGKTWEEIINELMAGLKIKAAFGWPNRISVDQPYGHWIDNDTLIALPPSIDYDLSVVEPAGDICMPLPDYAKFIQMNLQGLCGKDNILKASTWEYLHFGRDNYAMGWRHDKQGDGQISWHSGSAGTFYCYTVVDKNKKLAFIFFANASTDGTKQAIMQLTELLKKTYSSQK